MSYRMNRRNLPHLVWIYGESLTAKLDRATWLETSSELAQLGWRITLIAAGPTAHQDVDGVEVVCLPKPDTYFIRQVIYHARIIRYIHRYLDSTDVILFHATSVLWLLPLRLLWVFTNRRRPIFVMDTRDLNIPETVWKDRLRKLFYQLMHRLANAWVDGQTAITQRMADLVHIPPGKLWGLWPSGVNPAHFARARITRQWPETEEPIHLMFVGVMLPERNLQSLCEAVEIASAEGMAFVLSLIGGGPMRAELEELARQAGDRIRVIPPVPREEIPAWLAKAHVGVTSLFSPGREIAQASSPIKLFEYMAAGLPVLSTRNVCHTDVAGEAGYMFWAEDGTAGSLLSALRQVWSDRRLLNKKGEEAAAAVQAWTWQAAARKLKTALDHGLAVSSVAEASGHTRERV